MNFFFPYFYFAFPYSYFSIYLFFLFFLGKESGPTVTAVESQSTSNAVSERDAMALLTRFQFPSKRWYVLLICWLFCADLSCLVFSSSHPISSPHLFTSSSHPIFSLDSPRYDRVGQMSGGERRRLQLLQVLARAPNVLLLDEPSKYRARTFHINSYFSIFINFFVYQFREHFF